MGTGDMYGAPGDAVELPLDMASAIERFRGSRIAMLLGEAFSTNYAVAAEAELAKYVAGAGAEDADEVTEWERERYLPTA